MLNILDPKEGESIYDRACGTGGVLLEAIHHVKDNHGDDRTPWGKLFAQEKNPTRSAISRMNLFLHGASDFQVVRGDSLRSPAFFSCDNLARFDSVIANPPFSLEKWGDEVWASDPFEGNFAGMPPGKRGDYAWAQHMIKSLAPKTGRMAVVLPHGAFFRMGNEGEIRENLLGKDLPFRGKPQRGRGTPAFKVTSCNLKAWPRPSIASTSPTPSPTTVLSWLPPS